MIGTKRVVVTGAAKLGLGEAITRSLLASGVQVIGTYELGDADRAATLVEESEADLLHLVQVDHTSRAQLKAFTDSVTGPIAGLVNGQFVNEMEDPSHFDHDLFERLISINLFAPNFVTMELGPRLSEGASIVTITSTEGFIGSFGGGAYAAAKAAMHNLTMTYANVFGDRRIRANAVAGGWIGGVEDTDEIFNVSRDITPLHRLGDAQEVANVVLFLLSDASSFVNGSVITADGGYMGVDALAKFEYLEYKNLSAHE